MEDVIRHIVRMLRSRTSLLSGNSMHEAVLKELRAANKGNKDVSTHIGKRKLWPFLLKEMRTNSTFFTSLNLSQTELKTLEELLTTKPIRTASGVATVTVLTKPYPCSGTCVFCPNDLRMPKSYIHNEPACQRAERLWFDPYLQVYRRLEVLREMGHDTGKVELIVLGGTWTDYPEEYQRWFILRCFCALNDFERSEEEAMALECHYHDLSQNGEARPSAIQQQELQEKINAHALSYNAAWRMLYSDPTSQQSGQTTFKDDVSPQGGHYAHKDAFPPQSGQGAHIDAQEERSDRCEESLVHSSAGNNSLPQAYPPASIDNLSAHLLSVNTSQQAYPAARSCEEAPWESLEAAQRTNEKSASRCVGLVLETRPDKVDARTLAFLRRLGATKLQIGVQSTHDEILQKNARENSTEHLEQAFALLRLFGFKIHAHAMVNLVNSTPAADIADYRNLVTNEKYLPDEIKLYPCALVAGTKLELLYKDGAWSPYTTEELVNILAQDILVTPAYMRISRMIRDIPSSDILVGNKKTNLRQMVEKDAYKRSQAHAQPIREIRMREIHHRNPQALGMSVFRYHTSVSDEHFIQMTTPDDDLVGFCRLSLPTGEGRKLYPDTPAVTGGAMIRELHVYGIAVGVGESHSNGQHRGIGSSLLHEAEREAKEAGFKSVRVISAVGTRDYYRKRGYKDAGLYLEKNLDD